MKKMTIALIVALMLVSVLAACSPGAFLNLISGSATSGNAEIVTYGNSGAWRVATSSDAVDLITAGNATAGNAVTAGNAATKGNAAGSGSNAAPKLAPTPMPVPPAA